MRLNKILLLFGFLAYSATVGCEAPDGKKLEQEKNAETPPADDYDAAPSAFPSELLPAVTDLVARAGGAYESMADEEKINFLNFIKRVGGLPDELAVAYIQFYLDYPGSAVDLFRLLDYAIVREIDNSEHLSIQTSLRGAEFSPGVVSRLLDAVQLDHPRLRGLMIDELGVAAEEIENSPIEKWPFVSFDAAKSLNPPELAIRLLSDYNGILHSRADLKFLLLHLGGFSLDDRTVFTEKLAKLRLFYQNDATDCDPGCDSAGLLFDIVKFSEGASSGALSEQEFDAIGTPDPLVRNGLPPFAARENIAYKFDLSSITASYRGKGGVYSRRCPSPNADTEERDGDATRGRANSAPGAFCGESIAVDGRDLKIITGFGAVVAREGSGSIPLGIVFRQGANQIEISSSAIIENNDRPFAVDHPDPVSGLEGEVITAQVIAADPDGDAVLFGCVSGCDAATQLNSVSGELSFNAGMEDAGLHNLIVEVRSAFIGSKQRERVAVVFDVIDVNRPPLIIQPKAHNVAEGDQLSVSIIAHDPDGDQVTILCKSGCDAADVGMDDKGNLVYKPSFDTAGFPGAESVVRNFVISASDGQFTVEKILQVVVDNSNRPAVLTDIADKQLSEKDLLEFSLSAFDPDNNYQSLSFECHAGCPRDAYSLDDKTGEFSWRPGFYSDGTYHITFRVRDGEFFSDKIAVIQVDNLVRPPFAFSASLNRDTAAIGDKILCLGSTSDPDGELLKYTYRWYFSATTETPPVIISGQTQAEYQLSADEVRHGLVSCRITADDSRLGVTESSPSPSATVINTNPNEFTASLSPSSITVYNSLTCQGETTDVDLDSISYSYSWFHRAPGEENASELHQDDESDPDKLLVTSSQAHGEIFCNITARDGHGGERVSADAGVVLVENTPPTAFASTTDVSESRVGDSIACLGGVVGEGADLDGDQVSHDYSWYASGDSEAAGSLIAETISNTYEIQAADARHSFVSCRVNASDGWGGFTHFTRSPTVLVLNTPPAPFSASVSPSTLLVGQRAECLGATFDVDLDVLDEGQYSHAWFFRETTDGDSAKLAGQQDRSLLVTSDLAHGRLSCQVTASDLHGGSQVSTASAEVAVLNTPPDNFVATVDKTSVAVNDTVSCGGSTTDADGDVLGYSWQWFVTESDGQGGAPINGETSPSLDMSAAKNDALNLGHKAFFCEVTAGDGNLGETLSERSASVSYINSPPSAFESSFSETPTVGETLVCNSEAVDPDGDSLDLAGYQWFRQDAFGIPVLIDEARGQSFTVTAADAHGAIACDVIADDGRGGTRRSSSTGLKAVENSAPIFEALPEDRVVNEGEELIATLSVSDVDLDSLSVSCEGCPSGANVVLIPGQGVRLAYQPSFLVANSTDDQVTTSVKVTIDDGFGATRDQVFKMTVNNVDRPPTVTVDCAEEVSEGGDLRVSYTVFDPDGEAVVVDFLSGFSVDSSDAQKIGVNGNLSSNFSQTASFDLVGRGGDVSFDGDSTKGYIQISPEIKIASGDYLQIHTCEIRVNDVDRLPVVEMLCPDVLETDPQQIYVSYQDDDGDVASLSGVSGVGDGSSVDCSELNTETGEYTCGGSNSSPHDLVSHSGPKSNGVFYLDREATLQVTQTLNGSVLYQRDFGCQYRVTDVDRPPQASFSLRDLTLKDYGYAVASMYNSANDFNMNATDPDGDPVSYSLDYSGASCSLQSHGTIIQSGSAICGSSALWRKDNTWRVRALYTATANGLSDTADSVIDVIAKQAWGFIYNRFCTGGAYRADIDRWYANSQYGSWGYYPVWWNMGSTESFSLKYNRPPGCPK
jgi:hypothetical protein